MKPKINQTESILSAVLIAVCLSTFMIGCSSSGDKVYLTTQGHVSVNEQLWHHLGTNHEFPSNGYKIYFRNEFVGVLKVNKEWYDLRQAEGEYVWKSLENPQTSDLLACFNELLNGSGDGSCSEH